MMIAFGILTGIVYMVASFIMAIKMKKNNAKMMVQALFVLLLLVGFINPVIAYAYVITVFVLVILLLIMVCFF